MTDHEIKRLLQASADASLISLGAVGGGPPLKYLWIPFAFVGAVLLLVWAL